MRPILALLALAVVAIALRVRRDANRWAVSDDPYAEPVPMAAWDGTATYNPNAHTIRIRWMPTTTEV